MSAREIVIVLWPDDRQAAAELRAAIATLVADSVLREVPPRGVRRMRSESTSERHRPCRPQRVVPLVLDDDAVATIAAATRRTAANKRPLSPSSRSPKQPSCSGASSASTTSSASGG